MICEMAGICVMIKLFKELPHHLKTACIGLIRHMAMTLSSVSAVMVTLLLIAVFLILAGNLDKFAATVEGSLKIHVSIDKITTDDEINTLQTNIQELPGIETVAFSSSEDELSALIDENGDVFERYKDNNPMPDVFIVEVAQASDIPAITDELNALDHVEKAQYGGETVSNMVEIFDTIRDGGTIFVIGLCLLAVFLISNTIKMTIYTRNTEISIMRSVGATNGYIKTPFMMEGMFIGMLGSLLPILITWVGYSVLFHALDGQFLTSMFLMEKPFPYVLYISLLLLFSGAVVGLIGSFFATTRYLRWRR